MRAVAEGDLVALHTHQTWPGGDQYVTMDFFRFDAGGKIVEHWDAIQAVPAETQERQPDVLRSRRKQGPRCVRSGRWRHDDRGRRAFDD